ncbi:MAG: hypothetical protein CMA87_05450, partial [Euryarchaeota archaeon]|nr:hypothetical protein [Euryarchaeota archaeon]
MSNDQTPAVLLDNTSKWYGQVIGLNDVSLAIDGGVTGVLGPNGAGKSTLLSALTGELNLLSGQ